MMMSHPNNEKAEDTPPPYSEYQLYEEPDILKPPSGPAPPPMGYGAVPPLPSQCPPYYSSPGVVGPSEGALFHPPQAVFITPVQPTYVPDYLAYSIFTMLCCCVPLGIAAFVYSMLTRVAVGAGDTTVARTNSRKALFYANLAVLFGVIALIVYLLLKMTVAKRVG